MQLIKVLSATERRPLDFGNPVDAAVFRIVRSVCGKASGDILEDCLQEARLCLWLARERLAALEEPMRSHYAGACIRNAAGRHMRSESRYQSILSPIDRLGRGDDPFAYDRPDITAALSTGEWLDRLDMPDVAREVASLPTRDRNILNLYYGLGMTDREIAMETSATIGSVVKRRSRAIRRLRSAAQASTT